MEKEKGGGQGEWGALWCEDGPGAGTGEEQGLNMAASLMLSHKKSHGCSQLPSGTS